MGLRRPAGQPPIVAALARLRPQQEPAYAAERWPVLGQLSRFLAGPLHEAPAGFRALAALAPGPALQAAAALALLPTLGPGLAIDPAVRQSLARVLGPAPAIDEVRVHVSPVAEALGAEAFTSGRDVVFAPGRLDTRSARGLALLAHEISHVGQPLGFKLRGDGGPVDADETAARRQEQQVQDIIEHGWPAGPDMAVRRAVQPLAVADIAAGHGAGPARGPARSPLQIQRLGLDEDRPGGAATSENLPLARLSQVESGAAGQAAAGRGSAGAPPDLNVLARQVYALLKSRLRAEHDRH